MKKQKLLHIVPHDNFVPPKSGGALRCYHLCAELSKYFDVTLLTLQKSDTFGNYLPDVNVINPKNFVLKPGLPQKLLNAINYRWLIKSLEGPTQSTVLEFHPILKELSTTTDFDFIIIEFLHAIELGKLTKYLFPKAIQIADLHNVDHLLFSQFTNLKELENKKHFEYLKRKESTLNKYVNYFFTCSENDLALLRKINETTIEGFVVPNGISKTTINLSEKDFSKPNLIFCGNLNYLPNKRGLLWFNEFVWPLLKRASSTINLTIVGRNGEDKEYAAMKKDPKINFVGAVESVLPYYLKSNMAIVPLLQGSGTRLKVLEAMSLGNPVVSTTLGAEGIEYTDGQNIILNDDETTFAKTILTHLEQPESLREIAKNGLQLIQDKYDWAKIGNDTAEILKSLK